MTTAARDRLLLLLLSLLVNGLVAALIASPGYTDAYYYSNGGRWMAQGQPLTDPYLWNYVNPPAALPTPAFGYWQPLPSMVAALGMWLFGPALGSAQIAYVALAAALPQLAYILGSQVGERRQALLAGWLTVFAGFYVIYWTVPESFAPMAVFGAGALLAAGFARNTHRRWLWLLGGACAALGHLSRADGVLLLGVVGLVALLPSSRGDEADRVSLNLSRRALDGLIVLAGYLLIMAPWFIRNIRVFGGPLPSGGTATLWMLEHNDLFLYPASLTPARYFSAGAAEILRGKWEVLRANLATFIGVQNLVILTPFTLIALWKRWRSAFFIPAVLYGVLLFLAMTLAFSFPGAGGGWFHSGAALMPFITVAAALGLDDSLRWMAARRRGWHFERSRRVFAPALVFIAFAVTAFLVTNRVIGLPDVSVVAWNHTEDVYDEIEAALQTLDVPGDALVMSNNTPGFYYKTGRGGIPIPNGDEDNLLAAADAYHVMWLVIDNEIPAGLQSFNNEGPRSSRFRHIETFDSPHGPTTLYQIAPPSGE